jgi:pyruvate dehydrogenase E2 component (dihydrolipoamide acetyltransferase)
MASEVFMPKMSDHMESGEIVKWLVAEGQVVTEGQALVEVMTDKAATEIEAPATGILRIRSGIEPGTTVNVGEAIAFIVETADEVVPERAPLAQGGQAAWGSPSEPAAHGGAEVKATLGEATDVSQVEVSRTKEPIGTELVCASGRDEGLAEDGPQRVRASPAARRTALKAGIALSVVKGTGPGGFISEKDVQAYLKSQQGVSPV